MLSHSPEFISVGVLFVVRMHGFMAPLLPLVRASARSVCAVAVCRTIRYLSHCSVFCLLPCATCVLFTHVHGGLLQYCRGKLCTQCFTLLGLGCSCHGEVRKHSRTKRINLSIFSLPLRLWNVPCLARCHLFSYPCTRSTCTVSLHALNDCILRQRAVL